MSELSQDARELIARARTAERADASAKKRVRVALAAHLGPAVPASVAPTVPAAAGSLGTGLSASKLVLICSLTAAGVAGTTALVKTRHAAEPGPAPQRIERSAPAAVARPASSGSLAAAPAVTAPLPVVAPNVARPSLPEPVRRISMRAASPHPPEPVAGPAPAVAPVTAPERTAAREPAAAGTTPAPIVTAVPERVAAAAVPVLPTPRESPGAEVPSSSWRASHLPMPVADREGTRITLAAKPSKECTTERELRLLSGAQAALRAAHGQRALDLIEQHAANCPSATFWQERSAVRVLALCLLHREPQALAEAAQLVSSAPLSPLLARLRTSCAAAAVKP